MDSPTMRLSPSARIVQLLLDSGGSAEKGELVFNTCRRPAGDTDALIILQMLYESGAPVDNVLFADFDELRDVSMVSSTPLWESIGKGDVSRVRFLLGCGASTMAKEPSLCI